MQFLLSSCALLIKHVFATGRAYLFTYPRSSWVFSVRKHFVSYGYNLVALSVLINPHLLKTINKGI